MIEQEQTYELNPDNPGTQYVVRIVWLALALAAFVVAALFATGVIDAENLLAIILVLMLVAVVIRPLLHGLEEGIVTIGTSGIVKTTRTRTTTVPWSDVRTIENRNFGSERWAFLARLLRVDTDVRYVRIELARNLRRNLAETKFGTSKGILPSTESAVVLYIHDPEGVTHNANELRAHAATN